MRVIGIYSSSVAVRWNFSDGVPPHLGLAWSAVPRALAQKICAMEVQLSRPRSPTVGPSLPHRDMHALHDLPLVEQSVLGNLSC